ncbi:Hint domain-containing protein [Marimonas arenosa]|uniref:Hint domain-containing protein n=1 Tax=Marimonas arenosa TaxID=1795305 RepID=A0AAE4B397_9RHOB|nr:Hint domain-containing protein [Marimonas arenosa]MDQ2089062.1 Hint domain-containing protein [Marimonas arenosa]
MTHKFARGEGGLSAADLSHPLPAGFAAGASILTLDGKMPVECLAPGDRIITRDCGMAILSGVSMVTQTCDMIAILPGTLGHTKPDGDTRLPAGQKVLLRDWRAQAMFGKPQALACAHKLVDGEFIRFDGRETLRLIVLEFDTSHILYVDGMELACVPRELLENAA